VDFNNQKILIAIIIITLLLLPAVAFTAGPLRITLGLLFLTFFSGYTLLSALFPKRDDLGGIERLALSFGLSIAVVPLIGLILNYTPWGIKLYPVLISVTFFIIVTLAVAWYRQRKLPATDRFSVTFKANLSRLLGMAKLDKALSISLAVAIVVVLGCLSYVIAMPKQGEKFTEFYILNIEGKAEGYPKQVILGDPVEIVIGVINHEYHSASYRVGITIDGIENSEVSLGTLAHEERCEERVSFIPQVAGEKQKVEFYLYKNGEAKPYFEDPLHLYVDIITSGATS